MKKILYIGMMEIVLILLMLTIAVLGFSQNVPKTLSFQGYLTNKSTGEPLTSSLDMRFSLFDATTGGNELWFDDYSGVAVTKS
ncbi:MAG: hypothetical protein WDO14_05275 [Bacteroidota bacterium]